MFALVFALWSAPVDLDTLNVAYEDFYAPAWTCGNPRWVGEPVVRDDIFSGTMTSDCSIRDTEKNGLASLDAYLLRQIASSTRVHAGPIQETYRSLPGVRYDVTNVQRGKDGDTVTIRSDERVATDRSTKLIYSSESKKIDASGGDGKALKKIDIEFDVTPNGARQFKLKLPTYVEIKKPALIPGGAFKKKAMEIMEDEYLARRAKIVPDLAKNL